MPIITEKQRSPARPGRWRWIALAAALLVLSLPLVLTLFPDGIRVGRHGIRAGFNRWFGLDGPHPGFWGYWDTPTFSDGSQPSRRLYLVGWRSYSYDVQRW